MGARQKIPDVTGLSDREISPIQEIRMPNDAGALAEALCVMTAVVESLYVEAEWCRLKEKRKEQVTRMQHYAPGIRVRPAPTAFIPDNDLIRQLIPKSTVAGRSLSRLDPKFTREITRFISEEIAAKKKHVSANRGRSYAGTSV
jgi:hypothetical protein